jgi:3-phenylpropionate/trans-cinnamate dioxygenase ferredoxin reductase component
MSSSDTFVIVGAGMAGGKAAETLREEGFDGRVVLIGAEPHRPYERPPLSKDYLRGESPEPAWLQSDEGWYAANDIELRTSSVVESIDAGDRAVVLSGGERLGYDRLLLATGGEPRRLPVPGGDFPGVHLLRTIEDSDSIQALFDGGGRLVVIGGGWIGCEVAASARQLGLEVTMLPGTPLPLEHVLGPELGAFYADVHRDQGVTIVGDEAVEALEGDERVARLRTDTGREIECDIVVAGIGVLPRVELAERAGLPVANGVVADARLQVAPGVFAAGDVALHDHPRYGPLRIEHWHNALEQGPAAARAMLGNDEPYDRIPYFFSDQYDVGMEYAGHAAGADRVLFRGDPATREFIAFWLRGDVVLAGMNVNVWDVTDDIQALIRAGTPVEERRLLDPGVPLGDLVSA